MIGLLLTGRAGIHVDFHADRDFDDFGCFPGHLALHDLAAGCCYRCSLVLDHNFANSFVITIMVDLSCSCGIIRAMHI